MGATGVKNLESEFGDESKELTTIVEDWFADNCVEGRYNLADATENSMVKLDQVRIPMMKTDAKGRQRAVDTRAFVGDLRKYLNDMGVPSKLYLRGLGGFG